MDFRSLCLCAAATTTLSMPVNAGDAAKPQSASRQEAAAPMPAPARMPDPRTVPAKPARGAAAARSVTASPQLVDKLTTWLVDHYRLPRPAARPRIELVSPLKIAALRHLGVLSDRPEDVARIPVGQREVLATYDPWTGTIYLRDDWSAASPRDLSILLHELVHHLQASSAQRFACPQESEALAYAAQERWLGQFGGSLEADFEIDPFTLLVTTRCAW
jgi:hypothetical protein